MPKKKKGGKKKSKKVKLIGNETPDQVCIFSFQLIVDASFSIQQLTQTHGKNASMLHFSLQVMSRLLRSYEKNCAQYQALPDPSLKKALQDGKEKAALLAKVIVQII